MVPVKNLGELRWYSGCFYERGWEKGVLKISQPTFAEQLADEYGIELRVSRSRLARNLRSSTRTKHQETGRFVNWSAH